VPILVAICCVVITACVMKSEPPPSAPLPKPTVYEWTGTAPTPSSTRLAQDKASCFREAEQRESPSRSDRWSAHMKSCMEQKGWGEKAID
jgi:hypothetical protein